MDKSCVSVMDFLLTFLNEDDLDILISAFELTVQSEYHGSERGKKAETFLRFYCGNEAVDDWIKAINEASKKALAEAREHLKK